jgi:hypothetical protein
MDKEQIKKIILETAGNPISGAVFELADEAADKIYKLFAPVSETDGNHSAVATRETRITEPTETR